MGKASSVLCYAIGGPKIFLEARTVAPARIKWRKWTSQRGGC